MKSKIALSMSVVMSIASFSTAAMAASGNSLSGEIADIGVGEMLIKNVEDRSVDVLSSPGGIDTIASGTALKLEMIPLSEVESGSSIILTIENGKFDERLVNADPFIFRTKVTNTTYDEISAEGGDNLQDQRSVLEKYIKDEGSSEIPYGFKYIDETHIEVYLYPLSADDVNQNSDDTEDGRLYYSIALPVTTEDSTEGAVTITVDSNNSVLSSGTYTIANVAVSDDSDDDSTTEESTETVSEDTTDETETTTETADDTTDVTETTTESTTAASKGTTTKKSSKSSGNGGGLSVKSFTTTTTEATTEAETESDEVSTEETTESTTEALPEVSISIGSSDIVVDGKTYTIDASPYIQSSSNSTLVPLRVVAVALSGGNVESADESDIVTWDSSTKQATISKDGIKIVFTAGSNTVTVNGQEVTMDNGVTAEINNGRMYVPFRFIGETLGYSVDWDSDTKTAVFKS